MQRGRSQLDIRSSFLSGRWCSTGTGCLGVLELHQSSGEWVRHGHSRPDPLALVRALLQETYRSTNPTKHSVISWATPRSFHRDYQGSLLPTSSVLPGAWAADLQKLQLHFRCTTTVLASTGHQRGLLQLSVKHTLGSCRTHSCHPTPPSLTSRETFLSLI